MPFTDSKWTPLNIVQHGLGNNLFDYALKLGYNGPTDAQGGDITTSQHFGLLA
jgi:hypothetical protein